MTQKTLSTVVIVAACYVAVQMLADIASLRILSIAGFSVDGGTLVYPLTFTLRDLVHKVTNKRTAQVLIITAAAVNVVMAVLFWIVSQLPPDTAVGLQAEFGAVLSPVWRIVSASILAEVVAEFIDGEVYEAWVNRVGHRYQWGRVLSSNAVAIPIDSLIFTVVAFGGALPWSVVVSILFSNIFIKGLTAIVSMPLIYAVKEPSKVHVIDADLMAP